ncbi:MAG: hypothetical protein U0703_21640 [Anaerolineae bacterium]
MPGFEMAMKRVDAWFGGRSSTARRSRFQARATRRFAAESANAAAYPSPNLKDRWFST